MSYPHARRAIEKINSNFTELDTETQALAAELSALRGLSGPVPITTSYQSPLDRWTPVADRRDTLEAKIGGSICRVWTDIGNLDPLIQYSLELRAVVRDFTGSPIGARAYILPQGTQVSLPSESLLGSPVSTLGLGDVEEITIQAALLGSQSPARLLWEIAAGPLNATATPYQFYQLVRAVAEVGPIP